MGKKTTVIKEIQLFVKRISKQYSPQKVILFGSYAKGTQQEWSDIDLLIISEMFEGIRHIERGLPLYKKWGAAYPVDFVCYTVKEFEKARLKRGLARIASEEGKIVYTS